MRNFRLPTRVAAIPRPPEYLAYLLAIATAVASSPVWAAFPAEMSVTDLDGETGFVLEPGPAYVARYGNSSFGIVSAAGDINADGIDDVIIGDPAGGGVPSSRSPGKAFVVFGRPDGFPPSFDPDSLDGLNGFSVTGLAQLGEHVSAAGDFNHDGIDDVLVSEMFSAVGGRYTGRAFVVFGRDTASGDVFPADINVAYGDPVGDRFVELRGAEPYDLAGSAISAAGDINGDGIDDIVIGASHRFFSPVDVPGQAYVVYGRDTRTDGPFPGVIQLGNLNGADGFTVVGIADGDRIGNAVAGLGDVNNDGVDDLLVAADFRDATFVIFGRDAGASGAFPAIFPLASVNGSNGFRLVGASISRVARLGDIDNDGINDIAIGKSVGSSSDRGEVFVVYGRDSTAGRVFPAEFDMRQVDGTDGFIVRGGWQSSTHVAGVGDVNGDGIADLGTKDAPREDDATYVVFGRDTGKSGAFPRYVYLDDLDGENGFIVYGVTHVNGWSSAANRLSAAGDLNADGVDDLFFGDREGTDAGRVFVVYGRAGDKPLPTFSRANFLQFVGDLNGNRSAEIAWYRKTSRGVMAMDLRDTASKAHLAQADTGFQDKDVVGLGVIEDIDGSGSDEFARLVVRANGTGRVQLHDAASHRWLGALSVFNPDWNLGSLASVDTDRDGRSELAVLGIHDDNVQAAVQLIDPRTGHQVRWLPLPSLTPGDRYVQISAIDDVNLNGSADIAALRIGATGVAEVTVIDGETKQLISRIGFSESAGEVIGVTGLADRNANRRPEVALLLRKSNGRSRIHIKDAFTGQWLGRINVLAAGWVPRAITSRVGSGYEGETVAVIGEREDGSDAGVQLVDPVVGAATAWIGFDAR